MGLCKCPKRKVTNLFCFEHRVNVCEWCLLANHESCVVQTYLSWLTDSDYDANCLYCSEPLNCKETLRLKCLHLFHWDCFDARASQLPDTTAPAGYKCPSCLEPIFPSENQQSPVIDKLKMKLQTVNWGRLGLGLPTLPALEQKKQANFDQYPVSIPHHAAVFNNNSPTPTPPIPLIPTHIPSHEDPFEINTFTARSKLLSESNNGGGSMSSSVYMGNEDDSKYTKKSAERNLRNRITRLPRSLKRILIALFALIFLYVIFTTLVGWHNRESVGLSDGQADPLFDPHANPNIRVQRSDAVGNR